MKHYIILSDNLEGFEDICNHDFDAFKDMNGEAFLPGVRFVWTAYNLQFRGRVVGFFKESLLCLLTDNYSLFEYRVFDPQEFEVMKNRKIF